MALWAIVDKMANSERAYLQMWFLLSPNAETVERVVARGGSRFSGLREPLASDRRLFAGVARFHLRSSDPSVARRSRLRSLLKTSTQAKLHIKSWRERNFRAID